MSESGWVTPADGNVFADIGFPPAEAENLKLRCDLMLQIERIIESRGLRQAGAARLFGVSQPRISDLKRGKIDAFTIDSLVNMLGHAGYTVDVTVRPAVPGYPLEETAPAPTRSPRAEEAAD